MIMNKEVPLKERIEKLYESGYVNEFNYLENQLQEARYLVTILHKQTEEKDKEIERLNNIIDELEKWLEEEINNIKMNYSQINGNYFNMQSVIDNYERFLNKIKKLKEGK